SHSMVSGSRCACRGAALGAVGRLSCLAVGGPSLRLAHHKTTIARRQCIEHEIEALAVAVSKRGPYTYPSFAVVLAGDDEDLMGWTLFVWVSGHGSSLHGSSEM